MDPGSARRHARDEPILMGERMLTRSRHRKVLIVDDDPSVRQLLRIMLEVEDFEVVGEASNGIQAVPQAVELQPDFILLDQQMPQRDGAETALLIRDRLPAAQIIAFSAVIDRKPLWADAFLSKQNITDVAPLVEALIDLRDL
jgi:DNA-binding NarL/FixJ family response regulator